MTLISEISQKIEEIFVAYGLDSKLGTVVHSKQSEADFQCNGALQAASILKKNPQEIAKEIKVECENLGIFETVSIGGPGFLNFKLSDDFIKERINNFSTNYKSGAKKKIIIDYGGPNVAKPLHVGHLRAAIIGESIKRIAQAAGHEVIGDVHLGDWGTPMGMLIAELQERHPEWVYFDSNFQPSTETETPPFSVDKLNSLYPEAAQHSKDNPSFADKARTATVKLQEGHAGYRALWKHFVDLSVKSIKSDYDLLGVKFDLWLGESDADPVINSIVEDLLERGIAKESDGAIVVDVSREDDKSKVPPLMLRKSDGAATYGVTDLATIFQRVRDYGPDHIFYVVDKRQSEHFQQVFRAAAQAGYIAEDKLEHMGFGTMNGKDGKPFKTRDGGVMRLSDLIETARQNALSESGFKPADITNEIREMADAIAIGAINYGDLSNPIVSDYVFDIDELVRFEGDTGPYVQYAFVRANSVLGKVDDNQNKTSVTNFDNDYERALALKILQFPEALENAFDRRAPNELCGYMQTLSRSFSSFYKNCPIASEQDRSIQQARIKLTQLTSAVLKKSLHMTAIPAPQKMLRAEGPSP